MAKLKDRKVAIVIAVIVVILATLFGVHRSVGAAVRDIEEQFYTGVRSAGEYTGIGQQLEARCTAALGLVTVAENYAGLTDETEALRSARETLIDAESITEKYGADKNMQAAYEVLYAALTAEDLSDRDSAAVEKYATNMDGAREVIQNSAYNALVSQFIHQTMNGFPVKFLKYAAFTVEPEYFGYEG
jgi:hypothetical protein